MKRCAPMPFHSLDIVRVYGSRAFASCDLAGMFRKTMDCRVAFGNLHDLRVGVICVAADEADLCRQTKLHIAVSQRQLRLLALGDIDIGTDDPLYGTVAIVQDETPRLDPSNLTVPPDYTVVAKVLVPLLIDISPEVRIQPG